MITGYITRGTTIHGRTVDEGSVVDMDADTFNKLRLAGLARKHEAVTVAEEPAKPVIEIKPSKKKAN